MLWRALIWIGVIATMGTGWVGSAAIFDRQGRTLSEQRLNYNAINWQLLSANAAYTGIGLIRIRGLSTCTGFFIKTNSHDPTAPAYVMTNAHCIDLFANLPTATEIIVDRPLQTRFRRESIPLTFTPNYFAQPQIAQRSYPAQRVVYATMKNSDVALLELPITQSDLIKTGITPLTLASKPSQFGEKIDVVGVPGSKVPVDRQFLHRSTCIMGPTVKVKEGIYQWNQALRNHCSIVSGMSGSPMLAQGQVVGIINTGGTEFVSMDDTCALDNPCEKHANGSTLSQTMANYGQLLDRFPSCFNAQGVFSLTLSTCQLEKP